MRIKNYILAGFLLGCDLSEPKIILSLNNPTVGGYDVQIISYPNCNEIRVGRYNEKRDGFVSEIGLILAEDCNRDGEIEKVRTYGIMRDSKLEDFTDASLLSQLERELIGMPNK